MSVLERFEKLCEKLGGALRISKYGGKMVATCILPRPARLRTIDYFTLDKSLYVSFGDNFFGFNDIDRVDISGKSIYGVRTIIEGASKAVHVYDVEVQKIELNEYKLGQKEIRFLSD